MAKNMTKAQMQAEMDRLNAENRKLSAELKGYETAARTTKARTTTSNDFVFVYEVDGGAFLRPYVRVPGAKGSAIRYGVKKSITSVMDRTPAPKPDDFKSDKAFKKALSEWEKNHPKYRYTSYEENGTWKCRSKSVPEFCYVLTKGEYEKWKAEQKKNGRNWTVVKDLREINNLR